MKQLKGLFKQALKFEQKMLKCCESTFTKSTVAFKMKAKTYLSSKRVLLANMFEDNGNTEIVKQIGIGRESVYRILADKPDGNSVQVGGTS